MAEFIKGMDISTLYELKKLGVKYYDNGKEMELLDILKNYGVNSIRLRLWVDPYDEDGNPYGAGTNDIIKTIAMAKKVKEHDMGFLLDLHYSDFWTDPGKQNVPKSWRGMDIEQLTNTVYEYTMDIMKLLRDQNVAPTMVQVGNELTNGLLWPTGKKPEYETLARYISAGIKGVRAVDENVPIMIHLDNGGNNEMYVDWFEHYIKYGEDFQVIGLSYYPFWHGDMPSLEFNMRDMAQRYHKELVVAEVSMGFTMEDYAEYEKLNPEDRIGMATRPELVEKIDYPMTKQGQCDFMNDLMNMIADVPGGRGFYYWEAGWIPVPGCGWATREALRYTGEKGPGGNEWANQALFDYDGNALPALEVIKNFNA